MLDVIIPIVCLVVGFVGGGRLAGWVLLRRLRELQQKPLAPGLAGLETQRQLREAYEQGRKEALGYTTQQRTDARKRWALE